MIGGESLGNKLSFAGSIPVVYQQESTLRKSDEVIREVSEPTSPNPYYNTERDNMLLKSGASATS